MADKIPYVHNYDTGLPEVQQPGDTIEGTDIPTYKNGEDSDSHIPGQVVYMTTTVGEVKKARANAVGTMPAIAIALATILADATGAYQSDGNITLTTDQWDAVAGTTGGLTAGSLYFVSAATAGSITDDPPDTAGQFCQAVLRAISATKAKICLEVNARKL